MQEDTTSKNDAEVAAEATATEETPAAEAGEQVGDPVDSSTPDTPASGEEPKAEEAKAEDAEAEPEPAKAEDPKAEDPKPEPAPTEPAPAEPASSEPPPTSGGLDPQLVVLCAVLWLVAMGIFVLKWGDMRLDWHLGNIKESLDTGGGLPTSDFDALLTYDHGTLVGKLKEELNNPQQNDQRYRGALVRLLERVPTAEAFQLLKGCAEDVDARVRANAYLAISSRGLANQSEREEAFNTLLNRLRNEPEPNARGWACRALADYEDTRAAWQLILILAHADGNALVLLRRQALDALRKISGKSEEEIPFDIAAPRDQRDRMVVKWEAWYTGEAKGEIPEGMGVLEYRKKTEDEFWTSREPSDKSKVEWHIWNLSQSIGREREAPADSLARIVEHAKKDINVAWPLFQILRERARGEAWLAVRRDVSQALRKILETNDLALPYDHAADVEKRYDQLQAIEDAFVKAKGLVPRGGSLKAHRAAEKAARKLADAGKKPLDKSSADKANKGS